MSDTNSLRHAAKAQKSIADNLALALQKTLTELEYAHARMGEDRKLTRGAIIREAKTAIKGYQARNNAMRNW